MNDYDYNLDVLMICHDDWANTGWRFSKCLQMLGLNAKLYKCNLHKFNYPVQAELLPQDEYGGVKQIHPVIWNVKDFQTSITKKIMDGARVIHFHASGMPNVNLNSLKDYESKKFIVQHGGTTYRLSPSSVNQAFQFTDAQIIQCPDLLNLGAQNEHLIYYPVDTDLLKPNFGPAGDKVVIGHFPSRPSAKGTKKILNVINKLENDPKLKDKFSYVGTRSTVDGQHGILSWEDHLNRVSNCDLLIETLNLSFEGKVFGEWGNTAIETAALGTVVLTNSLTPDLYAKEYGGCALNIVNDEDELEKNLRRLISLDPESLKKEKVKSRDWAVSKHSMKATAKRLWDKVYCNLFPASPSCSCDWCRHIAKVKKTF